MPNQNVKSLQNGQITPESIKYQYSVISVMIQPTLKAKPELPELENRTGALPNIHY